jgi:hypothetical protein
MTEHAWQVNADEEASRLRERVRELEGALRPFVASQMGYASGISRGVRWCAPKVTAEQMAKAREVLG